MSPRALLLPCLVLSLACDGDKAPTPSDNPATEENGTAKPIDTKKQAEAKKAKDAIVTAPAEMRAVLAAAAIAELDQAALPASLVEGLKALTHAPPDMRATLLAKSLSENLGLLEEVCGSDGKQLMQSMATMDPAGRESALWEGCDMERHGVISKSDRAVSDPMLALFAHMVFVHVSKARTLSEDERSLLTSMMLKGETSP